MTYYNKTNLECVELQQAKENAQTLEQQVLAYYANRPNVEVGPSDVWAYINGYGHGGSWDGTWPITSVRRAITNLTAKGFLEKTCNKSIGIYGKPEYKWKFNTNTL